MKDKELMIRALNIILDLQDSIHRVQNENPFFRDDGFFEGIDPYFTDTVDQICILFNISKKHKAEYHQWISNVTEGKQRKTVIKNLINIYEEYLKLVKE